MTILEIKELDGLKEEFGRSTAVSAAPQAGKELMKKKNKQNLSRNQIIWRQENLLLKL